MSRSLRTVTIARVTPTPRPWLDWAIAGLLTILGVFITAGTTADDTSVDSIVVAAVTLPVIWRRRAPLAAAAAVSVGMVVSAIPTFDQTRCGVAIPAALLIAFSLAARRPRGEALAGLGLITAGLVVLLFTDPELGFGALFIFPLCAGVWWTGRLTRSRNRVAAELAERSRLLAQTRADSARLAVEIDRAAIAADLEGAAREPLRAMVALAGTRTPQGGERKAFADIERQGRDALNDMRQILGRLRSDDGRRSPQPTLTELEALLAGTSVELVTTGERRALPAGVELAAYRLVEHALEALSAARVELRYLPDAIELEIHGSMADTGGSEAALAAARERVTAHGGSFSRERVSDRTCTVRGLFPVAAADG